MPGITLTAVGSAAATHNTTLRYTETAIKSVYNDELNAKKQK